jgi:hypothetical protein
MTKKINQYDSFGKRIGTWYFNIGYVSKITYSQGEAKYIEYKTYPGKFIYEGSPYKRIYFLYIK